MRLTPFSWAGLAAAFAASPLAAAPLPAPDPAKEAQAFFEHVIAPIFSDACYKCHSAAEGKSKGGLQLDTKEAFLKGGDDGKIVTPGDPAKSMLIDRILSKDPDEKMPPKDASLSAQQVADLTRWVKMGAPYFAVKTPGATSGPNAAPIAVAPKPNAKKHWAWQPVRPYAPPAVKAPGWAKTPVDLFIQAKLERQGMEPSPQTDRATLIRRAYFDLIGLPPMPWEVQAFIDDKSPKAWESVIDRLLATPRYGERWGRYWLDVARYSDTKGDAGKKESPLYVDAWTYRDYVIDSFNRDKPYDRFIVEQIAADKLNLGTDKRPLAALGFLTLGDRFNGNKNDMINDQIDVVTKGFLGLTVSCARCHDHMFDPIPQKDYYSLHGIFSSTVEPKENPIIAAQSDAKQYQDYLKARAEAMDGVVKYLNDEVEKVRTNFRQHAGELLMISHVNGPDRKQYIEKTGLNAKQADDMAQFIKRSATESKSTMKRSPIFAPFMRFADLPKDQFAAKAKEVAAEIQGTGKRGFVVNPQIAAMFREKTPKSLDEVVDMYSDFFQKLDKRLKVQSASPGLASATGQSMNPALEELKLAPFSEDFLKELGPGAKPDEISRGLPQRVAIRMQQLMSAVAQVEMSHPGAPKRAMVVEDTPTPVNSPVFIRGEAQNKGEIVPHRFLEILSGPTRAEFKQGSGRLELAEAIASPKNPLTARVMVNRIWLHHFGEGFVTTPDDFGTQSAPPSHPELIDYLAARFMQTGWSIKAMHKLIMMSAVYQQNSEENEKYAELDPNNHLLWRYNIRRLDFEPVRDSLLYIAGELDLKYGGQPVNILSEPYSMRRSVYGYIDRRNLPELMNHFDFASPSMEQGKRHETTVPQQALFMMNSPLVVDVARKLLARPEMAQAKTDPQRVHALYWMIYQRAPKSEEIELGLGYLNQIRSSANVNDAPPAALASTDPTQNVKMSQEQRQAMKKANRKQGPAIVLENAGEKVDRKPLTPWEKYTQALLMANETIYYN